MLKFAAKREVLEEVGITLVDPLLDYFVSFLYVHFSLGLDF